MIEPNNGWGVFLIWTAIKFVVLTLVLVFVMLLIDPFAFEQPLAVAEAGLEAAKAPSAPFTTAVVFSAEPGDPIKFAIGARDANINARIDVISPSGIMIDSRTLQISKPTMAATRQGWQSFSVGVPETGTYTLRITQNYPGLIKVYLFQGPFVARMIALPFFAALMLLLFNLLRRKKPSDPQTSTAMVETQAI